MSRIATDTLAMLRGLQLVAKAGLMTQEQCTRHVWANSAIRELLQNSAAASRSFGQNPQNEIQHLLNNVRETGERFGVVAEGIRQYTAATISDQSLATDAMAKLTGAAATTAGGNTNGAVDISSITLKELESILSQRNRSITLTTTGTATPAVAAQSTTKAADDQKPVHKEKSTTNPSNFMEDEAYVKGWMKFIASHEPKPEQMVATVKTAAETTPIKSETATKIVLPELSSLAKQRAVPSSRLGRLASFGTLFAGLGLGTANELAKGALGLGGAQSVKEALFSANNTERIVDTLCKVRGAALKIGQILSIQDSSIVSPEMVKAFDRVRQAADYMPDRQVNQCMEKEFGADWMVRHFRSFEQKPFAAASIGQVHRGTLSSNGMDVAVKIQYPGVAQSIGSDIDNLVGMLKVWDVFPAGFFIDNIVKVAKRELVWEVDYMREAEYTEKFGQMVAPYPEYRVPCIVRELTTENVITTELVPGISVDKCFDLPYEDRLFIAGAMLRLCLRELFELRCMQTDPNWSNFMYDATGRQLVLIDFGSTRFYTAEFIDNYRNVIRAAIRDDNAEVLDISRRMGFLTGYETKQMEDAHVAAVMTLGELFRYPGEFDFGQQETTKKVAQLVPTMVAHRLCPPPEEIYSIHRKLSGVFLLCARLNVKMDCRPLYREIVDNVK